MRPQTISVNQEPALHLQVEAHEASSFQGISSHKCQLLRTAFGFASLTVLLGISALAAYAFARHAESSSVSRRSSSYLRRVAFNPGMIPLGPKAVRGTKTLTLLETDSTYKEGAKVVQNVKDIVDMPGRQSSVSPAASSWTVSELLEDVYKLKVPQLKAILKERGLSVSGRKGELLMRLEKEMQDRGLPVYGNKAELLTLLERDVEELKAFSPPPKETSMNSEQDFPAHHLDLPRNFVSQLGLTTENYLHEFTVPELKNILKARGLPVSGRKILLVTRLEADIKKEFNVVESDAEAWKRWKSHKAQLHATELAKDVAQKEEQDAKDVARKEVQDATARKSQMNELDDQEAWKNWESHAKDVLEARAPDPSQDDDGADCGEDGCEIDWGDDDEEVQPKTTVSPARYEQVPIGTYK